MPKKDGSQPPAATSPEPPRVRACTSPVVAAFQVACQGTFGLPALRNASYRARLSAMTPACCPFGLGAVPN